jgi:hypothetical protein
LKPFHSHSISVHACSPFGVQKHELQPSSAMNRVPGTHFWVWAAVVSRFARVAPSELFKQNFSVHTSWPVPEQTQVLQPSAALYDVPGVQLAAGLAPATAIVSRLARVEPLDLGTEKQIIRVQASWPVPEQ